MIIDKFKDDTCLAAGRVDNWVDDNSSTVSKRQTIGKIIFNNKNVCPEGATAR